MSVVTN